MVEGCAGEVNLAGGYFFGEECMHDQAYFAQIRAAESVQYSVGGITLEGALTNGSAAAGSAFKSTRLKILNTCGTENAAERALYCPFTIFPKTPRTNLTSAELVKRQSAARPRTDGT